MGSRSHFQRKEVKKTESTPQQSPLKTRPFAIQTQVEADQQKHPDIQTQLENAQKFGHHLADYAKTSAAESRPKLPSQIIQPKLTIGAPGDKFELEADRVAKQVVQRLQLKPVERSQSEESVQRDSQPAKQKLQKKPLADQIQRVDMSEEDEAQRKPMVQRGLNGPEPATEDLEGAIAQSRGRGQSLADTIRRPMEQAFGADFSGVRVHADTQSDQLNRSIQARAFTTGQDVFFRQGAYQPGSRGGQELIAHELTHVVQQGGATNTNLQKQHHKQPPNLVRQQGNAGQRLERTIQRAFGFEFETPFKIEKKDKSQESGYRSLAKMEKIDDYGNGLKMEADEHSVYGSCIEMVLDPPVQENEGKKLTKVLREFKKLGKKMDNKKYKNQPTPLNKLTGRFSHSKYRVTPSGSGFIGNPQITGGIAFDKLFTLMKETNDRGDKNAPHRNGRRVLTQLVGEKVFNTNISNVEQYVVNGSQQLKGLVALLARYIEYGNIQGMMNYAKLLSYSMMARTDFGAMFKKLPEEEKNRYIDDNNSFVNLVLTCAGNLAGDQPVIARGVRKSYNKQSNDYDTPLDDPIVRVTRSQWLQSITQGHDLLSADKIQASKHLLEGLGALGDRTDRVGDDVAPQKGAKDKGKGIILEFREMKRGVLYTDFIKMAQEAFDYIKDLNARR